MIFLVGIILLQDVLKVVLTDYLGNNGNEGKFYYEEDKAVVMWQPFSILYGIVMPQPQARNLVDSREGVLYFCV